LDFDNGAVLLLAFDFWFSFRWGCPAYCFYGSLGWLLVVVVLAIAIL